MTAVTAWLANHDLVAKMHAYLAAEVAKLQAQR